MSAEERAEELRRCKEGHKGMSGEEYFFLNYCYINGKLPTEYTKEKFKEYQENIQTHRKMLITKHCRPGPKMNYFQYQNFIAEYPLTEKEAFNEPEKLKGKDFKYLILDAPISDLEKDAAWIEELQNKPIQNSCPHCGENLHGGIVEQIEHYNSKDCSACPKEEITLKDVEEAFKMLEKAKPKKSKGYQAIISCKTRGVIQVNFSELTFCKDPECGFCVSFKNALEALVKEDLEK